MLCVLCAQLGDLEVIQAKSLLVPLVGFVVQFSVLRGLVGIAKVGNAKIVSPGWLLGSVVPIGCFVYCNADVELPFKLWKLSMLGTISLLVHGFLFLICAELVSRKEREVKN